jgi:hypothetical protein
MFEAGDFTASRHAQYDAALREHFTELFEFCMQVREWCLRPFVLNALIGLANRRMDLRERLVTVILGGAPVRGKLTLGRVLRALAR